MPFTYEYPRPALSADCLLFAWEHNEIQLLLIRRKNDPFAGCWALPGGFVDIDEDLQSAAAREVEEETGLKRLSLHQLKAYGAVNRDPRTRVITIAHWGLVTTAGKKKAVAGDDAAEVAWQSIESLPKLAFDHQQIISDALGAMKQFIAMHSFGREWLGKEFTVQQWSTIAKAIGGKSVPHRRWFKKLERAEVVVPVNKDTWRFDAKKYRQYQTEMLPE